MRPARETDTLQAYTSLGRYRLVSLLGRGGMGEVYLAEDARLGRKVAVKVPLEEYARDPAVVSRFEREARAASAISHPNVAQVFDVGEQDGLLFMAMEYVEGEPISSLTQQGPLEPLRLLDVAVQIADALDAAHAKAIVHRDLKPQNVLVTHRGLVKVLDFGIAKRGGPGEAEALTAALTQPGLIVGTVDYMSPEQALGRPTDQRTDIFSLGVILYVLATARLPFIGRSVTEKIDAIIHADPPAPGEINAAVPPELERIVRKCLEKDAERRYQTARELRVDLQNLKRDIESGTARLVADRGRSRAWRRAAVLLATVVIVLSGSAWFGYGFLHRRPAAAPAKGASASIAALDSIAVLPFQNATGSNDLEYLSEGVTETLINEIGRLRGVKVISRASAFRYRSQQATDVTRIGRELGVKILLLGRVVRRAGQLGVNVEMVDAVDGAHIWGDQYAATVERVSSLDRDVAARVTDYLAGRVGVSKEARYATSNEAYELYLRGRHHFNQRTAEDLMRAVQLFDQATAADPKFALAHVGRGQAYVMLMNILAVEPAVARAEAASSAQRALALQPSLGEAHAILGFLKSREWDWTGAEAEYLRATQLSPNDVTAYHWYAMTVLSRGRFDEAKTLIDRALALDPMSVPANNAAILILYYAGRTEEAARQAQKTIALDPTFAPAHKNLARCDAVAGRYDDALREAKEYERLAPGSVALTELGWIEARRGEKARALQLLKQLDRLTGSHYVSPVDVAAIHLALGDRKPAYALLEKALADRSEQLAVLRVDPRFAAIRSEARFVDILKRINLG